MRHFLVVFLTLIFSQAFSQKQKLAIGGYSPGLYMDYNVGPNESFSSIASKYNLHPDSLSEFNNMDFYEGALRAKTLKIPLTSDNFYQQGTIDIGAALVPVYFVATYNQSLQQVTTKVNRIPLTSVKQWNADAPETLLKGNAVLVGFLKTKPEHVAFFEDTVTAAFAKVDITPVARPRTDSSSIATSNNRRGSTIKTNTPKTSSVKTDSVKVASAVVKKPVTTKTDVPKVTVSKTDTSSLALNKGTKTGNGRNNTGKSNNKTDTSATTSNTNRRPVTGASTAKNNTGKKDTLGVASNTKLLADRRKAIADSIALAKNNARTSTTKRDNAKPKVDSTLTGNRGNNNRTNTTPWGNKVDSIATASNSSKNNTTKKPVEKPKTAVDSSALALKNSSATNKNGSKTPVPKPVNKTDTSVVAANRGNRTNTNKTNDKQRAVKDSSSVALSSRNTPNNKADSSRLAATVKRPISTPAVKGNNSTRKIDSTTIAGNQNIKNQKPVVKQPDIKKVDIAKVPVGGDTKTPRNTNPANTTPDSKAASNNSTASLNAETFEGIYNIEIADKPKKQLSGEASYFESRTGWEDKKYYVLMPHVEAGTIVKITSKDNRSVYAKVLGSMPEMKENDGVLLRLSNAAVAALGINNPTFPVVVSFY